MAHPSRDIASTPSDTPAKRKPLELSQDRPSKQPKTDSPRPSSARQDSPIQDPRLPRREPDHHKHRTRSSEVSNSNNASAFPPSDFTTTKDASASLLQATADLIKLQLSRDQARARLMTAKQKSQDYHGEHATINFNLASAVREAETELKRFESLIMTAEQRASNAAWFAEWQIGKGVLAECKAQIDAAARQSAAVNSAVVDEHKQQLDKYKVDADKAIADLQAKFELLEASYKMRTAKLEHDRDDLQQQLATMQDDSREQSKSIAELQSDIETLQGGALPLDELDIAMTKLRDDLSDLQKNLDCKGVQYEHDVDDLKGAVQHLEHNVNELKTTVINQRPAQSPHVLGVQTPKTLPDQDIILGDDTLQAMPKHQHTRAMMQRKSGPVIKTELDGSDNGFVDLTEESPMISALNRLAPAAIVTQREWDSYQAQVSSLDTQVKSLLSRVDRMDARDHKVTDKIELLQHDLAMTRNVYNQMVVDHTATMAGRYPTAASQPLPQQVQLRQNGLQVMQQQQAQHHSVFQTRQQRHSINGLLPPAQPGALLVVDPITHRATNQSTTPGNSSSPAHSQR